jgi:hypothetical protein
MPRRDSLFFGRILALDHVPDVLQGLADLMSPTIRSPPSASSPALLRTRQPYFGRIVLPVVLPLELFGRERLLAGGGLDDVDEVTAGVAVAAVVAVSAHDEIVVRGSLDRLERSFPDSLSQQYIARSPPVARKLPSGEKSQLWIAPG